MVSRMLVIVYLFCVAHGRSHAAVDVTKEDASKKLDGIVDELANRMVDKLFDSLLIPNGGGLLEYPSHEYDDSCDDAGADAMEDYDNPQVDAAAVVDKYPNNRLWQLAEVLRMEGGGKVHGSLTRAGKVKNQTPKVPKQPRAKRYCPRKKRHLQYIKRFVGRPVQTVGGDSKWSVKDIGYNSAGGPR